MRTLDRSHDSDSTADRAQTAQDFMVGVGVFLIAVTFVIGFFPELVAVYDAGSGAEEASLADRIASTVLNQTDSGAAQNDVDSDLARQYFENDLAAANVRSTLTISETRYVNVTIRTLDRSAVVTVVGPSGTVRLDGGHGYDDQSAVTLTRVVTMKDDPGVCTPACRIVVRVW